MNNEKLHELMIRLNEKTLAKQIIWKKSSGSEEFKLSLKTGPITIQKVQQRYNSAYIEISLYNLDGDMIENHIVSEAHKDYQAALDLFTNVRRTFYKVEETLDDILSQLSTDDTIGKDEDDDLPF